MKIKIEQFGEDACSDGLNWFKKQEKQDLVYLVKTAIKEGKISMEYCGWGICKIMTKEQRIEWGIFSAYQVAYLWKDEYPKEYAIWDKWASGKDRSDSAWSAAWSAAWDSARDSASAAARAAAWDSARAAARDADWDAAWAAARDADWDAAYNKTLAKILRYGVKILLEEKS